MRRNQCLLLKLPHVLHLVNKARRRHGLQPHIRIVLVVAVRAFLEPQLLRYDGQRVQPVRLAGSFLVCQRLPQRSDLVVQVSVGVHRRGARCLLIDQLAGVPRGRAGDLVLESELASVSRTSFAVAAVQSSTQHSCRPVLVKRQLCSVYKRVARNFGSGKVLGASQPRHIAADIVDKYAGHIARVRRVQPDAVSLDSQVVNLHSQLRLGSLYTVA